MKNSKYKRKFTCEIPGCLNEYSKLLRYKLPTHSKQSEIVLCYKHYYLHYKESLTGGNRNNGVLTINKRGLPCSYPIITTKTATEQYKFAAGRGGGKKKQGVTSTK